MAPDLSIVFVSDYLQLGNGFHNSWAAGGTLGLDRPFEIVTKCEIAITIHRCGHAVEREIRLPTGHVNPVRIVDPALSLTITSVCGSKMDTTFFGTGPVSPITPFRIGLPILKTG
jgi:hypothetical protein